MPVIATVSRCSASASLLEKLVSGRFRGAFASHVRFQPGDLVFQQRNTFGQFVDRKYRQILPDLMGNLLLWPVVIIDRWHGRQNIAAVSTVVTSGQGD